MGETRRASTTRAPSARRRASIAVLLGLAAATLLTTRPPAARASACAGVENAGWTEQCPSGARPAPRMSAATAELPDPGGTGRWQVVLFGGCGGTLVSRTTAAFEDGSSATADMAYCPPKTYPSAVAPAAPNEFDDTWIWDGSRWRQVVRPVNAVWPHARWGATLAHDRASGKVVLFGGLYQTMYPGPAETDPDIVPCWGWKQVMLPDQNGVVRYRNIKISSVTLANGKKLSSFCFKDTWLFDGTTWTRVPSAPGGPPARFDAAAAGGPVCLPGIEPATDACAPSSGLPILAGGCSAIGMIGSHGRPDLAVYWDCVGYPGAESLFTVRDPTTGVVKERKATMTDTWLWSGGAWVKQCPGAGAAACKPIPGKSYDCSAPRSEIFGISLCAPTARRGAQIAYNRATGGVVLFGGYTYDPVWNYRGHANDVWEWDAGTKCPDRNDGVDGFGRPTRAGPCWRLVMSTWKATGWSTPLPGPRAWGNAAPAGVGGGWAVVLFGGHGYSSLELYLKEGKVRPSTYAEPLDDTWLWLDAAGRCTDGTDKYDTTCWAPCANCVSEAPAPRVAASLAYDTARGRVVLFGGSCDDEEHCAEYGGAQMRGDTWTLLAPKAEAM